VGPRCAPGNCSLTWTCAPGNCNGGNPCPPPEWCYRVVSSCGPPHFQCGWTNCGPHSTCAPHP
jgi:hypothetical protein